MKTGHAAQRTEPDRQIDGKTDSHFYTTLTHVCGVLATADMMYVRFFPSFALGILIGLMRWHSGSLFPGMFFHVVHNGLLITVSSFPDEIAEYVDWAGEYREHLPLPLIIVSLIIALIAATWFIREQAKSRSGT